jgi:hypothetical protein
MTQAEKAVKRISDANRRGGNLEEQVLAWDFVQQNARRVEGFGVMVDEFGDGSVLVERHNAAFPNRHALAEWLRGESAQGRQ